MYQAIAYGFGRRIRLQVETSFWLLAVRQSKVEDTIILTRRRRGRRVRSKILERHIFSGSHQVSLHARQSLGRDGMEPWMSGSVVSPVVLGRAVSVCHPRLSTNLPGWNTALIEPLIMPAWKPEFCAPSNIVDAIITGMSW
jgi:hypothetical protein